MRHVSWVAAFVLLLVSHAGGDVLLQSEWQAMNKAGGLAGGSRMRALLVHVLTYMIAFLPALVWIGSQTNAVRAVEIGLAVAVPHLIIDDGRLVRAWMRDVKHVTDPPVALAIAVDQGFHLVCLLGAALLVAA